VCGTSLTFEPFPTEREAREALDDPASEALRRGGVGTIALARCHAETSAADGARFRGADLAIARPILGDGATLQQSPSCQHADSERRPNR